MTAPLDPKFWGPEPTARRYENLPLRNVDGSNTVGNVTYPPGCSCYCGWRMPNGTTVDPSCPVHYPDTAEETA